MVSVLDNILTIILNCYITQKENASGAFLIGKRRKSSKFTS
jgi:hypothetical protein